MVHMKSEYELQYHRLTNDLRAQIWRENVVFRESQKRINSSDHYWRYQLIDDTCSCDNGNEENDVLKRYRYRNKLEDAQKTHSVYHDKAVQTSDGNETVHELSHLGDSAIASSLEQKTPPFMEESNGSLLPVTKAANVSEHSKPASDRSILLDRQHLSLNKEKKMVKENHQPLIDNTNPSYVETPLKNAAHWSHLGLTPTRNALKHYHFQCKPDPVFAAFGCSESNVDVGNHKTFNVRAPVDQVHKTALMASGKRLKDLELHLTAQLKKKQHQRSQLSIGPVNSSSIWMTEYQECFSKGQREPLLRSAFQRPVVWRYP